MKEIYLDNSATTAMNADVAGKMTEILTKDYGNPSSLHKKGIEAERHIKEAKDIFCSILGADEKEIIFTSGGTESDNWAVFSAARSRERRAKKIITTMIEHPAVIQPVKELERRGFETVFIPVDRYGLIDKEAFSKALSEDTALVSVMMVNNEVGSLQPIEWISREISDKCPDAVFHVDGVQAFGKYRVNPGHMGIDLFSVSAHKIHGPKGVGLLYVSDKVKLPPFIFGGGQQKGMRSGTENTAGIAGFALAAKAAYDDIDADRAKLYGLKEYFSKSLCEIPDVILNGPENGSGSDAPHIVNASFTGVRSEVLLHALEDSGIYVSAGSACSSHKKTGSDTLRAMGLEKDRLESAIRFSFSKYTTKEELDDTLAVLEKLLPMLRRFTRK